MHLGPRLFEPREIDGLLVPAAGKAYNRLHFLPVIQLSNRSFSMDIFVGFAKLSLLRPSPTTINGNIRFRSTMHDDCTALHIFGKPHVQGESSGLVVCASDYGLRGRRLFDVGFLFLSKI